MSNFMSKFKCPDCKEPLAFIDDFTAGYYYCNGCKQNYNVESVEETQ